MKKFLLLFICILAVFFTFSGCKQQENTLDKYVSELRSEIFYGQSQNFTIKASYGFKEIPYNHDGKISDRVYVLVFKLVGRETDQATYNASFTFNGKIYKTTFKLSPVSHSLIAPIEVENFNLKQFTVQISSGTDTESIELKSTLPKNTISYSSALKFLQKNQSELVKAYCNKDGVFNGEICARIVVKDQKPYWYVGLTDIDGNLKALLIDGLNGEVLAIREVF